MNNKPLIIDSFTFAGFGTEQDVLEIRLAELYDTVDYFIIVEANRSQTRLEKPYFYLENKERYKTWADKIIYLQLEEFIPGGEADWRMENWQRNQIVEGLNRLETEKGVKLSFNDTLLISDLDEIPMASKLQEILKNSPNELLSINLYFNSYYADLYCPYRGWYGTIVAPLSYIHQGYNPQYLRNIKDKMPHAGEWDKTFFGWHLSALGGFETVWNKAKYNIEPHEKWMLDEDKLKEQYRQIFNKQVIEDKYFLFLDNPRNLSIKMEKLELDKLPKHLIDYKDTKFKHLFLPTQ